MKQLILVLIVLAAINLLIAETVVIEPTDDMYTDVEHPGTNPTVTELWVAEFSAASHFERIMMRFDLELYRDVTIQSATLHLKRFFSCPSSGTTVTNFYAITEEWDEDTWPFAEHVEYNESISMPYTFSGAGGDAVTDYEVDVTDFIQNWIDTDLPNYGFVIRANNGYKWSKFYSKEHSNVDFHPSLTLTFQGQATQEEDIEAYEVTAMNFPNPFNPETTISYTIPQSSFVNIEIFNVRGRLTYETSQGYQHAGQHQVTWNGTDNSGKSVASGLYYYRIDTNRGTITKPMIMLK